MIRAYNEMYLDTVMKNLAAVTDIAVNAEGLDADEFGAVFAASRAATEIEHAVPDMLAGKSAVEMLSLILDRNVDCSRVPTDRTPEYWAGWVLARAQWELSRSFGEILSVMPLSSLIGLYHPYHEADEGKTVDIIKARLPQRASALRRLRRDRRLTQEQLALLSGVNVRSIRAYEQGDNELSRAQGDTLLQLAHALDCTVEELLLQPYDAPCTSHTRFEAHMQKNIPRRY